MVPIVLEGVRNFRDIPGEIEAERVPEGDADPTRRRVSVP
jgi:hypothetical protein